MPSYTERNVFTPVSWLLESGPISSYEALDANSHGRYGDGGKKHGSLSGQLSQQGNKTRTRTASKREQHP